MADSFSLEPRRGSLLHQSRPLSQADVRLKQPSNASNDGLSRTRRSNNTWYGVGREIQGEPPIGKQEKGIIAAVIAVAACVRLWKIWLPSSVVFDEVHFGGFASKYIRQVFFMDVHPPLAKLLITLAAKIGGYDGNFEFKDIGKNYISPEAHVPYVTMRMLPALMGVAVVPMAYLTLRSMGTRRTTAFLGSALVTFENGLVTQSRLILLDSPLIFFTALTTLLWVRFSNEDYAGSPFGRRWWVYLAATGLSLGAVVSCKWVGLFTIATIGLCVLRQLWLLLGNLKVTPRMWLRHFAARALCLIVLPSLVYMATFQIHFWILNRSGDGDGFMSSEFQHTLIGHGMEDTYADVAIGSTVSIRHVNTQGGYLHSHTHAYPGGSNQQQVTLYPHRDDNNLWHIVNVTNQGESEARSELQHVINGMKIRFEHVATHKRLHSHDVRPPVSEVDFQNEVSGYGFPGFEGDANDDFVVELSPYTRGGKDKKQARTRLRTLRSHFRLRHAMTGCYLFSHKVKLPEWGFEQQEVTCNKNPVWDNSLWYIETNTHPDFGLESEMVNYQRPSFMTKFLELQAVMWHTNAGLTERHAYDSRPNHWPLLRRGINFWVKDHRQIYLIGNPVIWWSSTIAIALYLVVRGFAILRVKRGYQHHRQTTLGLYDEMCGFQVLGWALHYLPFYLMQRQLFLHHYFPALYFAIMCLCSLFDLATRKFKQTRRLQLTLTILLAVLYAFASYSPLTYGSPWTKAQCEASKVLHTWDFSCADFHDEAKAYSNDLPDMSIVGAANSQTTGVQLAVAPVPNIFEEIKEKEAPEGRTMELDNDHTASKIMTSSHPAQNVESDAIPDGDVDARIPLGKDAGAAEATGLADLNDGWQGDPEADGVAGQSIDTTVS